MTLPDKLKTTLPDKLKPSAITAAHGSIAAVKQAHKIMTGLAVWSANNIPPYSCTEEKRDEMRRETRADVIATISDIESQVSVGIALRELKAKMTPATRDEIATTLAILAVAFPTANRDQRYPDLMIGFVLEAKPYIWALREGVKELVRTMKFMPAIAEVLEAIDAAQDEVLEEIKAVAEFPERLECWKYNLGLRSTPPESLQRFSERDWSWTPHFGLRYRLLPPESPQ